MQQKRASFLVLALAPAAAFVPALAPAAARGAPLRFQMPTAPPADAAPGEEGERATLPLLSLEKVDSFIQELERTDVDSAVGNSWSEFECPEDKELFTIPFSQLKPAATAYLQTWLAGQATGAWTLDPAADTAGGVFELAWCSGETPAPVALRLALSTEGGGGSLTTTHVGSSSVFSQIDELTLLGKLVAELEGIATDAEIADDSRLFGVDEAGKGGLLKAAAHAKSFPFAIEVSKPEDTPL